MRKDYGTNYAQCRYNTAGLFFMGSASRNDNYYYFSMIIIISVASMKT